MAWPLDMGLRAASLRLLHARIVRAEDASEMSSLHRTVSFRRALAVGNLALVVAILMSFAHATLGAPTSAAGMAEAAAAGGSYPLVLLVVSSAIASLVLLWSSGAEPSQPQQPASVRMIDPERQASVQPAGHERSNLEMAGLISSMGHDLRTPLNAIIGFSDMMQQEMHGPLGSDRYQTYATHIRDSGLALLSAIEITLALTERLSEAGHAAQLSGSPTIEHGRAD